MITLNHASAARLIAGLCAQQDDPFTPLPCCPACGLRSERITQRADGQRVWFHRCRHVFSLTREALLAGLRAA
ncbi:hypothetical protein AB0I66_21500 [Streptomyces sp. NPDC050439]|uniref:hypothetical protein n=1 Tax=unclassified Streptomyces TaxID=2593676 RepID=UPI003429D723